MKSCRECLATTKPNRNGPPFCPLGFEQMTIRAEGEKVKFPVDDCPRPRTQAELTAAEEVFNSDHAFAV